MRRSLSLWFEKQGIVPQAVADFDDSALMKAFAQAGHGVFAAPDASAAEIVKQYGVKMLGRTDEARERFYAISIEKKVKHPAIAAIVEAAKAYLASPTDTVTKPMADEVVDGG